MAEHVHRWNYVRLACTVCGALGKYEGRSIVAAKCAVCGAAALFYVGPADFRCLEHRHTRTVASSPRAQTHRS